MWEAGMQSEGGFVKAETLEIIDNEKLYTILIHRIKKLNKKI